VTVEYAKFSRTAYGAAFVVTGGAVLATLCADLVVRSPWAASAYVLLPVLWLLSLGAARAYYQRRGSVIEPDQRVRGRGWILSMVYFVCATGLFQLSARTFRGGLSVEGTFAANFAAVAIGHFALVAVPLLAAELVRGNRDGGLTIAIVMLSSPGFGLASPLPAAHGSELERLNQAQAIIRGLMFVLAGTTAVALVIQGIRDHRRARSLERRLAALRSPAP
jgi:hypothetical protein